jgi:hypothetical protein
VNAALRADPAAMRVNLTVPSTAVRLGPFAFDGLKALLGVDLAEVLSSLMIGPKSQRPVLGGFVDVYPLAIPDGEGLTIPIKLFGEFGFYNLHSALVLVVPIAAMDVVTPQLAAEIAAGEAAAQGLMTLCLACAMGTRGAHHFRTTLSPCSAASSRVAMAHLLAATTRRAPTPITPPQP